MNSSNLFNIRKKNTLVTLMSFLPKRKRLELIRENKRLQKALKVTEVLYRIYSLKKNENIANYDLNDYGDDEYTKREILKSLFETSNLPFFNFIGFELSSKQDVKSPHNICHSRIINNIERLPPMNENQILIGSYSWDNTFKIWDIQSEKLLYVLKLPLDDIICGIVPLYDIQTCQDKKQPILIMVITWDKCAITYNLRNSTIYQQRTLDLFGKIMCCLKFNNYLLTSSYENEISVWNIDDLKYKQDNIPTNNNPNKIADNNNKNNDIKNDDSPKKIFVFQGHKGPIPKIIQYDCKRILSCCWDESVKIWNMEKFTCEETIANIGDKLINMTLLKDKIILALVMNDGYVKLLNLKTKEIIMQFGGDCFVYQLKDQRLITGLHEIELQIVNLVNKKIELIYKTSHKSKISGFIQLDDGRLITCSYDQSIKIHGFVSKKEKSSDAEDFIYSSGKDCLYITHQPKK